MVNRFIPPGVRRGRKGPIDVYPDVVGQLKRAEKGLSAPQTKKPVTDEYPQIVGNVSATRRAVDREVAKSKWKPPVDPKPGRKVLDVYPRIVAEDKYPDPIPPVKIPPVKNEDGSIWHPPDDHRKPRTPRSAYPDMTTAAAQRRAGVKRYRPPDPKEEWGYHADRGNIPESAKQYYRNCLGMTGEGLRTLLDYDEESGVLTWRASSGPKSGHAVVPNSDFLVRIGGFKRNIYGVIFLIKLNRLPTGWVVPADHDMFNLAWENIRPSESNVC